MAREICITVVTGGTGTGKSHQTRKVVNFYCTPDPKVGRVPRKVLIMDTNNEYPDVKTVPYDPLNKDEATRGKVFSLLKNPELRRVSPFMANGTQMTYKQKKQAVIDIANNYMDGLVWLEDFNAYVLGVHKSEDLVAALTTCRHKATDLLIHVQNLAAIEPRLWQNVMWIRFHYQAGRVKKDGKTPNYELIRIAQYMVDYMYTNCKCTTDKCECKRKYFFVDINVRTNKIRTSSEELYLKAVDMYKRNHKDTTDALLGNPTFYLDLVK